MSMFPHVVTLFNKTKDGNSSVYNKTVIDGVLFVVNQSSGRNKQDLNNSDNISLYIPPTADTEGKEYINEYEFIDSDKSKYYTINKGDYVGMGNIDLGDLSISEYKNKHGNLYEIIGYIDYKFGGLPNITVSCK